MFTSPCTECVSLSPSLLMLIDIGVSCVALKPPSPPNIIVLGIFDERPALSGGVVGVACGNKAFSP